MPICTTTLYHFDRVTDPEIKKYIYISGVNKTTCSCDPFPARLLMSHIIIIMHLYSASIQLPAQSCLYE